MDQLFLFKCGTLTSTKRIIVQAETSVEATEKFKRWLEARPTLPPPTDWICEHILGKLGDQIYAFPNFLG